MAGRQQSGGTQLEMRQALIDAALDLIDEAEGCRGVTLRAIAARAGCAHTNAYNYFPSLESLFWAALIEATRRSMETIGRHVSQAVPGTQEVPRALLAALLEFARTHPGWYRLIWLEPMGGEMPAGIAPQLGRPREGVTEMLRPLFGPWASDAEVRRVTDIIHSYIHGELCKLIARRNLPGSAPADPEWIEENTLLLLDLLRVSVSEKHERRK